MLRAKSLKSSGTFAERPADTIVLDFDARHRRRIALETTHGIAFLLDLPDATVLRSGDALLLDDGRLVEIIAAAEPLSEIRCADGQQLARIAWHLGNRHLPVEILAKSLRIRRDHVIETMVARLGGKLRDIEAPFTPESGAYAGPAHAGETPHGGQEHDHDHRHAHHEHHAHHGHHGHEH
jgi:urease accessory protein